MGPAGWGDAGRVTLDPAAPLSESKRPNSRLAQDAWPNPNLRERRYAPLPGPAAWRRGVARRARSALADAHGHHHHSVGVDSYRVGDLALPRAASGTMRLLGVIPSSFLTQA